MKITHTRLTPSGPLPVFITSNKVLKTSGNNEHLWHKSYTCGKQIDWSFVLITDLLDQHPHTLLVSKDQQPIVWTLIQLKRFFHFQPVSRPVEYPVSGGGGSTWEPIFHRLRVNDISQVRICKTVYCIDLPTLQCINQKSFNNYISRNWDQCTMRWIMGRVLSHVLESFLHLIEDTGASTLLLLSQCLCAQY